MLALVTDATLAESILGDLEEQRRTRARQSAVRAAVWYWRSALAILLYATIRRSLDALVLLVAPAGRPFRAGEVRHSVRRLRRSPWYTTTVIGTVALTTALVTTTFAISDGILFRGLPYPNASKLYHVGGPYSLAVSLRDVDEWQAVAPPGVLVTAVGRQFEAGATIGPQPRILRAAGVGPRFFEVLGIRPASGGFTPEDYAPTSGRRPALLTPAASLRIFGRAARRGETFDLVGAADHMRGPLPGFVVAGMLSRDFVLPSTEGEIDFLTPIVVGPDEYGSRNAAAATTRVRVPAGISPDVVRQIINARTKTQGFQPRDPDDGPMFSSDILFGRLDDLLGRAWRSDFRSTFILAMLLGLIAAANIAALGVARAEQRARDLALARALGAGVGRILTAISIETALVVGVGAALGLMTAPWLIHLAAQTLGPRVPLLTLPEVTWRAVGFTALFAAGVGVIIVLCTGRAAARVSATGVIGRAGGSRRRRGWFLPLLPSVQVAVTLALTVGGAFTASSLWWVWQQDPGIDPERVVTLELRTGPGEPDALVGAVEELARRVRAVPGVEYVGGLSGWLMQRGWRPWGGSRPASALPGREQVVGVSGDFFAALRMQPVTGRLPTPAEMAAEARVAVVSERVARAYWPGESALGRAVEQRSGSWAVIGVVPDARLASLEIDRFGQIYLPGRRSDTLVVRGRDRAFRTLAAVTAAAQAPGLAGVVRAVTLEGAMADALAERTSRARFYGVFSLAALVICGIGILGFVAMTTAMRTREMGIRSALGASRDQIARLILTEQAVRTVMGLVAGIGLAAILMQFIRLSLFQFRYTDLRVWSTAIVVVLMMASVGAFIPAWRAGRVDPMTALRVEK